jgi:hypothetical protein
MKVKRVSGYKVEYIACYRIGKSQYEGAFVYQIEVLVDGEREVFVAHAVNSISEAKNQFDWHLKLRDERKQRLTT